MKTVIKMVMVGVFAVAFSACSDTAEHREAIAFRKICASQPQLAECVAAKEQGLGAQ